MSTSYFCYLLNWFSEAILCGDGRCYSEGPMRDGCGKRVFLTKKRGTESFICQRSLPEPVTAGTEVGSVRTPRSKSFFSTMENRTWHVRSGGRHCRRCEPLAPEDDAASPAKSDENGYLTDPASVPERNRTAVTASRQKDPPRQISSVIKEIPI